MSLTYKVALLYWRSIEPLAILIYFSSDVLQEFKRSPMSGFVLVWAMYFWACLKALASYSFINQSVNAQSLEKRPTINRAVLFCCGPSNLAFYCEVEQLIGKKAESKAFFTVRYSPVVEPLFWKRGAVVLNQIFWLCDETTHQHAVEKGNGSREKHRVPHSPLAAVFWMKMDTPSSTTFSEAF